MNGSIYKTIIIFITLYGLALFTGLGIIFLGLTKNPVNIRQSTIPSLKSRVLNELFTLLGKREKLNYTTGKVNLDNYTFGKSEPFNDSNSPLPTLEEEISPTPTATPTVTPTVTPTERSKITPTKTPTPTKEE